MENLDTDISDEKLAKTVQQGQKEPFGILLQRYENKLLRYAGKFLYNYEDKQDLVQNVFLKAFVNIQGFDSSRSFSAWIYRIAHNEFINAIKKKGQEALPFFNADTLFPHPIANDNPELELKREEDKNFMGGLLDRLPAKYREPLILFYFEDMDYEQIADILQIPKSTVGVRLKRGREQLKDAHDNLSRQRINLT